MFGSGVGADLIQSDASPWDFAWPLGKGCYFGWLLFPSRLLRKSAGSPGLLMATSPLSGESQAE